MNQISFNLFKSLFRHQAKRRMIAQKLGAGVEGASRNLTYIEESILKILEENENSNVKELSSSIHLEKSWISRIVKSLEDRGLISSKEDPEDRRNKLLRTTKSGNHAIEELNTFISKVIEISLSSLSEQEIKFVEKTLTEFCNSMTGIKEVHSHGNVVHHQLHRMSRFIGIFGNDILGLKLNLIQIWVYMGIAQQESPTLNSLDREIPFDLSNISRTIQNLETEGYITKKVSEDDRRVSFLKLTSKGKHVYDKIVESFVNLYTPPLLEVGEEKIEKLVDLLDRVCPTEMFSDIDAKFQIKLVNKKSDDLVRIKQFNESPLKNKVSFALMSSSKLIGTAELSSHSSSGVNEIKIRGVDLSKEDYLELFESIHKLIENKDSFTNI